ncbi:XRE family transcriptional regulator [uncultured Rhodospira sp.]|uniref:XRE family transcriptional regulator n=1 Tax=uncultured Rhodospira sp. TaxID=1936189 RepID=UPI00262C5E30|nr:XRE family transcriptional regulator [uncultured Rhodospira sp.]
MIKPEVLVWTRTSAGLSVAEAAGRLHMDVDSLAAWEAGEDAPSIPQLRKLADLYKRPLAVFYLQRVPLDFKVISDLRRLPGTGPRQQSPELTLEIRYAQQRRELVLELADDLGDVVPPFSLTAERNEDPELVGERIRAKLDITADVQRKWRDAEGRTAFNAWRQRIENAGVLVFQATRLAAGEASGIALSEELLPVIVVNRKDSPTRRTFSLLHELAHLMLRVSGVSDLETDDIRPPEEQALEIFCNAVAAAALMPRDGLLSEPLVAARVGRRDDWTDAEIADLARTFGVSREAVARRLLTLGRATDGYYREARARYLAEYLAFKDRQRERSADNRMARNMPQETLSNVGRPLVQMVLGTYHQDRITLGEVAGYLGIKTKHIPKLEQSLGLR